MQEQTTRREKDQDNAPNDGTPQERTRQTKKEPDKTKNKIRNEGNYLFKLLNTIKQYLVYMELAVAEMNTIHFTVDGR